MLKRIHLKNNNKEKRKDKKKTKIQRQDKDKDQDKKKGDNDKDTEKIKTIKVRIHNLPGGISKQRLQNLRCSKQRREEGSKQSKCES
jgi:hypothetical protein